MLAQPPGLGLRGQKCSISGGVGQGVGAADDSGVGQGQGTTYFLKLT